MSHKSTNLERAKAIKLFGGMEAFINAHKEAELNLPSKYKFY